MIKHKIEPYKDLYMYDGENFRKLKETTSSRYIKKLVTTIKQSTAAIDVINNINAVMLNEVQNASSTIDNTTPLKDINEIKASIAVILDSIKEAFVLAKKAPDWITTLLDLEHRIKEDSKVEKELYGGKEKAFREDPENTVDFKKATVITTSKYS